MDLRFKECKFLGPEKHLQGKGALTSLVCKNLECSFINSHHGIVTAFEENRCQHTTSVNRHTTSLIPQSVLY